ncbi:MAG: glycosyltransferase [Bacteroidota bacterium]|nr:glycosyltransferase [Bacteroidota bacterium]
MKKKTVLMIFPDVHLPFSPTTLNLKNALSTDFEVTLIAFQPFSGPIVNDPDVKYFRKKAMLFRVFNTLLQYILNIRTYNYRYAIWQKIHVTIYLLFKRYDHYVVVDLKSFWFIKKLKKNNIHLLSLELTSNTADYKKKIDINQLCSIIIQSKERFDYLTDGYFNGKVFYVQNAPIFNPGLQHLAPDEHKLIFTGSAIKEFGILQCLAFLDKYPYYQLHIQGTVPGIEGKIISESYQHLISGNRLIISSEYLSAPELVRYLNQFRIGLCFYDFSIDGINNFNYKSAPSGKMFTYFAAGVPVIAIDIPGLKIIDEFKAGILIPNLNPVEIFNAIKKIESNYDLYSANCLKAAKHFDFYTASDRFISYLKTIS